MMKIHCTRCKKKFEIDCGNRLLGYLDPEKLRDELSRKGHAHGIDRKGKVFRLCLPCTDKMIHE